MDVVTCFKVTGLFISPLGGAWATPVALKPKVVSCSVSQVDVGGQSISSTVTKSDAPTGSDVTPLFSTRKVTEVLG